MLLPACLPRRSLRCAELDGRVAAWRRLRPLTPTQPFPPSPPPSSRYGTLVAAKILKGSSDIALGDFRGEIEILRRVHHPNAVQFLGACTRKEPYILVTELMSGGSLADAFRRPEVFPMRRAVEIALDSARGLAYLHNRKPNPIIHRDLKPGNLMLSGSQYQDQHSVVFDTGVVKLADFGLSKTLPINKHAEFGYLDSKFRLTGETGARRGGAGGRGRGFGFRARLKVRGRVRVSSQPPCPPCPPVHPRSQGRTATWPPRSSATSPTTPSSTSTPSP